MRQGALFQDSFSQAAVASNVSAEWMQKIVSPANAKPDLPQS